MSALSNYLENEIADHILGGADYTRPGTVYVALFTTAVAEDGSGTEVSGTSYARVAVTNNATNWPAASGGVKSNGTEIAFPTAGGSWGTVTHWAIFDASTSGNCLVYGALTASKSIGTGDTAKFAIGAIDLTFD